MIAITKRDIDFGEIVRRTVQSCPKGLKCLWGEKYDCEIKTCFNVFDDKRNKIYNGECLIYRIKQEILDRSPDFLSFLRDCAGKLISYLGKRPAFTEQRKFLMISIPSIATFYSVNNKYIPWCSKEMIERLQKETKERPRDFYANTYKELKNLNSFWFEELVRGTKSMQVSGYAWGLILKVLKILLEGMKLPEQFTETDFKYLENFIRSHRKGP